MNIQQRIDLRKFHQLERTDADERWLDGYVEALEWVNDQIDELICAGWVIEPPGQKPPPDLDAETEARMNAACADGSCEND